MAIDPVLAQTLHVVVEEGTLDAAARRLHLTPSAVSQRLKLLEEQLGGRLLVRSKPVRATDAGRAVIRLARAYELIEHEAREALGIEAVEPGLRPRLTIAVSADSMATWFPEAVARFAREHDVQVELLREDQDATARLLADGTATAAVTSSATASPGCRVVPLGSLVYEAVAAPAWWRRWIGEEVPTTGAPEVPSEALAAAPRVDFDRSDDLQATWLRARGIDPLQTPTHHVPSTHDLGIAVELGLGWAMLLPHQTGPALREGRLVPLGGEPVVTPLYWQVSRVPSALLDALTSVVAATAREELRQG